MPGWFERRLDRELGPAAPGRQAGRESWLRDWPLILGLVLSAALVVGAMAVRGPNNKPVKPPTAVASAGAEIPGEVVDVGEADAGDAPDAAAPKDAAPAKKPAATKKKKAKPASSDAGDDGSTASHGGGTASGGASEGSNAGGGYGSRSRPGGSGGSSGGGTSGGGSSGGGRPSPGSATPGKIVNVTGTSATFTNGPFSYAFRAPTHSPVVGKRWVLSIAVKRAGKPLKGRVKIDILHQGSIVGHVANANLSNGRFAHNFDWPDRSVGVPLTVKTTVVGGGFQQSFLFNVKVKRAG